MKKLEKDMVGVHVRMFCIQNGDEDGKEGLKSPPAELDPPETVSQL